MRKESIVIHIGYHKSGNTYLWEQIFPKLPANLVKFPKQMLDLVKSKEYFDKHLLIQWIHEEIERMYKQNLHELTILSQEALSGNPHGYDTIDPFLIADNLKQAFTDAKILILFRHQFDYMLSEYTFRVAVKGYESRGLKKFLKEEGRLGLFDKLEYDRLVEYYMVLFGKENVLALPLELLKIAPERFHEKIAAFLQVSSIPFKRNKIANESTKLVFVIQFWRPINFLFACLMKFLLLLHIDDPHNEYPLRTLRYKFYRFKKKVTRHLNRMFSSSKKITFPPDFDDGRLLARYAKSNKSLNKLTNLDLRKLGYPIFHAEMQVQKEQ